MRNSGVWFRGYPRSSSNSLSLLGMCGEYRACTAVAQIKTSRCRWWLLLSALPPSPRVPLCVFISHLLAQKLTHASAMFFFFFSFLSILTQWSVKEQLISQRHPSKWLALSKQTKTNIPSEQKKKRGVTAWIATPLIFLRPLAVLTTK